jgi:polysaccharide pyruvyl transferase WcaK-like protein
VSTRPCYYLVGAAGFPNYGDEFIAAAWLRHLAVVAPEADVWLDCKAAGPAQVLLDGLHPRLRVVDTLWRLCSHADSDDPWQVATWVQHAIHNPGLAPLWVAGIELVARADVVHLIGGGYLASLWPRQVGLIAGAVAAVRRSGGRAVMTGQGLYPAVDGVAPLLRALVERFDVVDLRDEASARILFEPGQAAAHTSHDDAFLALRDGADRFIDRGAPAPEYMLCVQPDAGEVTKSTLAARVLDTLRAWHARPDQVGIVEGIPGFDREVYALIEHELPGARFYPFSAIWTDGLPLAPHQKWISTRFHLHLLAAAVGAGGVAISVHSRYYATKHQSLIDLGSGWTLTDATEDSKPPPPPASGGFSTRSLRRYADRKAELARSIYPPAKVAVR